MAIATRCRASIDDDIRAGRTVVANVSRTVIAKMRRRLCRCRGGLDHGAAERAGGAYRAAGPRQRRHATTSGSTARSRMPRPRLMSPSSMSRAPNITRASSCGSSRAISGSNSRGYGNDCGCDDRAARGHLRVSQRCFDGQGRRPRHAILSRADGPIAVRGAGDLRAGGARLLAARRSAGLCSRSRRQDADDAGPPRQQPLRFAAQHRAGSPRGAVVSDSRVPAARCASTAAPTSRPIRNCWRRSRWTARRRARSSS